MSGIYIPGRLQETDPVLFEALCLEMCLAHLGYSGAEVEHTSGPVRNPEATMFPDQTRAGEVCLALRVRSEVYDRELRFAAAGGSFLTADGKAKTEAGIGHTRKVECVFAVGPLKCEVGEFSKRWDDARSALQAELPTVVEKLFKASRAWKNIEGIAKALRTKGFEARR